MAQSGNNAWKYAVLVLIVAGSVEGLGFAVCKVLAKQGLMYDPVPAATSYAAYLAERDTVLGWPSP